MKEIKVEMNALYGYSCEGQTYGSEDTIELEIEDSQFHLLHEMRDKGIALNQDGIMRCLTGSKEFVLTPEQKTLLNSLHDQISKEYRLMTNKYWVFEADNECERDSLEPAMEQDIASGLYEHTLSFDEFMEESEEEYEDEEDAKYNYEERLYEDYREWVYNHDEDTELEFIAERVGCDLDCDDTPLVYEISLTD